MEMGKVLGIFVSSVKGVSKRPVESVRVIENYGIEGDAHASFGSMRQVSVLPVEALSLVPKEMLKDVEREHTENLLIEGIPLEKLGIGSRIRVGGAVLEVCLVGKDKPEDRGRAYIVSREGRFCRVVEGGVIKVGDPVEVLND